MPELPLPKFTRQRRPELSLEEILAKGREAAAAEGLIITGDTPPPPPEAQPAPEPQAPPAVSGPPAPAASVTPEAAAQPRRSGRAQERQSKPKSNDADRRRWDARVNPRLWVEVRKVALDRDQSPNDALEEALRDYVSKYKSKP
jgi:hypothetical protein